MGTREEPTQEVFQLFPPRTGCRLESKILAHGEMERQSPRSYTVKSIVHQTRVHQTRVHPLQHEMMAYIRILIDDKRQWFEIYGDSIHGGFIRTSDDVVRLLQQNRDTLSSITIWRMDSEMPGMKRIISALSMLSKLKQVSIYDCTMPHKMWISIGAKLSNLHIKKITIHLGCDVYDDLQVVDCTRVDDSALMSVAMALLQCTELESIHIGLSNVLDGPHLSNREFQTLARALSCRKELTSLVLQGSTWNDARVGCLIEAVCQENSNLQHLSIVYTSITLDESVSAADDPTSGEGKPYNPWARLWKFMEEKGCPLQELDLGHNNIDNRGLGALVNAVEYNTSIIKLKVNNNPTIKERHGADQVARMLRRDPRRGGQLKQLVWGLTKKEHGIEGDSVRQPSGGSGEAALITIERALCGNAPIGQLPYSANHDVTSITEDCRVYGIDSLAGVALGAKKAIYFNIKLSLENNTLGRQGSIRRKILGRLTKELYSHVTADDIPDLFILKLLELVGSSREDVTSYKDVNFEDVVDDPNPVSIVYQMIKRGIGKRWGGPQPRCHVVQGQQF